MRRDPCRIAERRETARHDPSPIAMSSMQPSSISTDCLYYFAGTKDSRCTLCQTRQSGCDRSELVCTIARQSVRRGEKQSV